MASFSSSSKKTKLFFLCAPKKKQKRERDTTEKEKSPNCLMYHYKKRGFKEKKGYHTTHTEEGLVFFLEEVKWSLFLFYVEEFFL